MENILDLNLIELHQKLAEFAKHHQNMGAQEVHRLVQKVLVDEVAGKPRSGSPESIARDAGYDKAIADVLSLIRVNFIP